MNLKISVLCNDGSPLGVTTKTIFGDDKRIGVGGAELAMLTMCEQWASEGHQVTLYNNPWYQPPNTQRFEQKRIDQFVAHQDRDVLIVFRSPNHRIMNAKGLKVWWSCDQFTVGNFKTFANQVEKIVVISPFHAHYFAKEYGINDSVVIDLPVRLGEYDEAIKSVSKTPNRAIFTSVPGRGLEHMPNIWKRVKQAVSDAHLVITSDYRLWGAPNGGTQKYRQAFSSLQGVSYVGAMNRRDLVKEQLKAGVHIYPCTYDELFCIAVAESQVSGAIPVTTSQGSLQSTNMAIKVGRERIAEQVIDLMLNPEKAQSMRSQMIQAARKRFDPSVISQQWMSEVFK